MKNVYCIPDFFVASGKVCGGNVNFFQNVNLYSNFINCVLRQHYSEQGNPKTTKRTIETTSEITLETKIETTIETTIKTTTRDYFTKKTPFDFWRYLKHCSLFCLPHENLKVYLGQEKKALI